jgi:tRNA/tmRNA/rRNA uracil-C5-methylase (TrmA/RlmC/RlmD family)
VTADSVATVAASGARAAVAGRDYLTQQAAGRAWRVDLAGFWQVHPAAADTLAAAVLQALEPRPGEVALDLYCGAGLFAGVLAPEVGPDGRVIGVESDAATVRDARNNLREWPWARVHRGDVGEVLGRIGLSGASLVVLDPPRTGAAPAVIEALCVSRPVAAPEPEPVAEPESRPQPQPESGPDRVARAESGAGGLRRIAYVSCDPATLARDLGLLIAGGWTLDALRAFDAFPMTHHVECLATLSR